MGADAYFPLAYDYPVLGAFWTVMWVFLWVVWLILLFRVIVDLFRDRDLSGWAKGGWLVVLVLVPFLGVLVYVIVRGRDMGRREQRHAEAQTEAMNTYLRRTLGTGGSEADTLAELAELRRRGDLSDEEFAAAKEKILH
ncbi:SHOCT domain-containing protein [Streptomyces sp. TR06-5]|uniref:SHOCT domain-containing protein n=1 Tax=unclassified Streptomyces TaxID=2593676 RepID=UPI0039A08E8B